MASDVTPTFWGDRAHRATLLLSAVLFIAAFAPTMADLVATWSRLPEYSHGFLMPVVALWMVWERRGAIKALAPKYTLLGVVPLLLSLLALLIGETTLFIFLRPFALVGTLGALVLSFYGWRGVGAFLPPLVALLLMCPLPERAQLALTVPLRETAATLATGLLDMSGLSVTLDGSYISLPGMDKLFVADACSGIRSLISLVSLAIIACMLWDRPIWKRVTVVLAAAPIAVIVNAIRIWLTGILSVNFGPEAARGFFHFFEGFALFLVAAVVLLAFTWALDRIFPPKPEPAEVPA